MGNLIFFSPESGILGHCFGTWYLVAGTRARQANLENGWKFGDFQPFFRGSDLESSN